ncbi:unnamed protein product [Rotaria sp. Silwood2]|nr:unnamed protein product [Rotaria sp. Silwood2]CAF2759971.1 unnamed protein product [Rotaria sp. Silwood2]CAF3043715.1 unnamed protein product [Rotaria sp. Silwood2]CAF4063438.1 unnamed protein product [Rotaria sp. Silwood2]CAF4124876.1 unnamed protein product [Rotaria sp. Silwood2]
MTEQVQFSTVEGVSSKHKVEEIDDIHKLVNKSIASSCPSTSSLISSIFTSLNMSLRSRCQALTILVWWLLPFICLYLTIYFLRSDRWYLIWGVLLYIAWMISFRKYPKEGGHRQQWFRRLVCWKWFVDYFPIRLHKTCDLSPDCSYIFGYHPHGINCLGGIGNFATEATDFEKLFPGINLRLLVLKSNFQIPFFDVLLTMMGICDTSKESCNYILKQGKGNSIMLVLGGSKEALDARPSSEYLLTLKSRKGFVKIALANGANLVPVFSFGENDLYEQDPNPRGSKLRYVQLFLQKKTGYALPLFYGRRIFQYKFGLLPYRHPINTYVGEPIEVPKLAPEHITSQVVDEYHKKYMNALIQLFNTHKAKHGNANASIVFVDDTNV